MKEKILVECFGFFQTALIYINIKNYKNIACTNFVNANIALNCYPKEVKESQGILFLDLRHFRYLSARGMGGRGRVAGGENELHFMCNLIFMRKPQKQSSRGAL